MFGPGCAQVDNPIAVFRTVAPGRLQAREGGGVPSIFGRPFFAAGLFVMLAAIGVIPMSNDGDAPAIVRLLLPLMGLALTLVGGALVFGRAWITIDTMQRAVIKEWGLLLPMKTTAMLLEGYTAIRLELDRATPLPRTSSPSA